jgi:hypothetical protein
VTAIRRRSDGAVLLGAALGAAAGLLALVGGLAVGQPGLIVPLAALAGAVLLFRPLAGLGVLVALVVVCEARDDSLLPALEAVYTPIGSGLAAVDLLFGLVVVATALHVLRNGLPVLAAGPLTLPLALLGLALGAGVVTGYAHGAGPVDIVYAGRHLVYLLVLPFVAVNLVRTRRVLIGAIGFGIGLAIFKAVLGLLTVGTGRGRVVDGSTITFYEPVANFIMLVALLGIFALIVSGARDRLPLWALLGSPLMLASLALSLRRSFWIGLALGLLLVLVLGTSPLGRRLLGPAVLLLLVGVWALGSIGFQASGPIVTRVESLKPSRVEANAEDRYRFDERANVLAELRARPISGLGLAVGWSSAARPLGVEHENGRDYTHMVMLWYWLKLGLLGLAAYIAVMATTVFMAWRVWREDHDALLRAAGLAGACSLLALAVVETSGSFTGVEPRYTIALGVLLGLIAAAYRLRHVTDE